MKLSVCVTTLAAICIPLVQAGGGSGAQTCEEQSKCFFVTIDEVPPNGEADRGDCLGDCFFEVCLTLWQGPNCAKDLSDQISHTCPKPETHCHDATGFDDSWKLESGLDTTHTQCQMIAAGNTAEFMIKDGQNGNCGVATSDIQLGDTGADTISMNCQAISELIGESYTSCGGGSKVQGGECIWSYTVPASCSSATTTVAPPPPTTTTTATEIPPPPTTTTTTTEAPPTSTTTTTTTEAPPTPTTTITIMDAPPPPITTTAAPPTTTSGGFDDGNHDCGGGGDPHFKRWGQEHDSFHGECDLVALHSNKFHNKGFDLHVRTTMDGWYSYIESAAVRIGDTILEVSKDTSYINGQHYETDLLPGTFGDYTLKLDILKHSTSKQYEKKILTLLLGEKSYIAFKFFKHFLTYEIHGHPHDFDDSEGLMGEHATGEMVSRDKIVMNNFEEFAFEWQVNPEDPVLFKEARQPQLPYEKCRMPTKARPARRHLRQDMRLLTEAQDACASLKGNDYALCIDDVMTTGEIGLADLW